MLGLLTGCPQTREQTGTEPVTPEPATPEGSAGPEAEGEPFSITITGNDQMQFDPTEFTVDAQQPVTIVFRNIGNLPKEAMGHNLVVLVEGIDPVEFAISGAGHANNEYIDPEREDEMIAYTPILGPGEEFEVTFTAPAEPGEYEFVCTFPGHAQAGMVGVMTVE